MQECIVREYLMANLIIYQISSITTFTIDEALTDLDIDEME